MEKKEMETGVQLGGQCEGPEKTTRLFNSQEEEERMRHLQGKATDTWPGIRVRNPEAGCIHNYPR